MSGPWIQTHSGRAWSPEHVDDYPYSVDEFAHCLARLCRFAGHTRGFYCPTPEQRILTADLAWVPAGDLRVGDELVGFDEHPCRPGSAGTRRRRFRRSQVLTAMPLTRRVVRLEMADGSTVRASEEHPWLVATKMSRNQKWLSTHQIARDIEAGRKRYMHRFIEPWAGPRDDYATGWLAGIYDGEGSFSIERRKGSQLSIAQLPGIVFDQIQDSHLEHGFQTRAHVALAGTNGNVLNLQMQGGWRENLRFLGQIRPLRLLAKFRAALISGVFDKQLSGVGDPVEIVAAYDEGHAEVAGLETSSRTYLCEGYGAHNSVAQHSVLVAREVARTQSRSDNAMKLVQAALLHDAAEAFCVDMPAPVKHLPEMAGYRALIARVERAIATQFKLLEEYEHPAIRQADLVLLATERRDVLGQMRPELFDKPWGVDLPPPSSSRITQLLTPGEAERLFLSHWAGWR